ncbi:hypothetical protein Harman_37960 [Haloarcula mannanilytica]|uniref:Uncharacterized protein n=1 Tax=Haloarcula mannanilytica TaxID=2509225 RepID=A0A4C2EMX3_9EURY|nr:hypothetical protein [Haloarcula mannanilytica]GCF15861.1 hypothetical protein Harman_37960 [Haloarcula mannanilytica]
MPDETFTTVLCRFRRHFRLLFMVSVLSLLILGTALTAIESGSSTYVITVVQIVTFLVLGSLSFGLMVLCARSNE